MHERHPQIRHNEVYFLAVKYMNGIHPVRCVDQCVAILFQRAYQLASQYGIVLHDKYLVFVYDHHTFVASQTGHRQTIICLMACFRKAWMTGKDGSGRAIVSVRFNNVTKVDRKQ